MRYVGATRQHPEARLFGHVVAGGGIAKTRWIRALHLAGVYPAMVLLELVPDCGRDLVTRECAWYDELVKVGEGDLNGMPPARTAAAYEADRRRRDRLLEDLAREPAP